MHSCSGGTARPVKLLPVQNRHPLAHCQKVRPSEHQVHAGWRSYNISAVTLFSRICGATSIPDCANLMKDNTMHSCSPARGFEDWIWKTVLARHSQRMKCCRQLDRAPLRLKPAPEMKIRLESLANLTISLLGWLVPPNALSY